MLFIEGRGTAHEEQEIKMSLTRKKLKAFGLTDEQIDSVIEEHVDTVNSLQADVNKYKTEAEKLPGVQKELDDLKAAKGDDWKKKFEDEHAAFESFKSEQGKKDTKAAKERALREILEAENVDEKRHNAIIKIFDIDALELGDDGKAKNGEAIAKKIKEDFADFVVQTQHRGAGTEHPPANTGGKMTKEQILAIKDGGERRKAMAENPQLFGISTTT